MPKTKIPILEMKMRLNQKVEENKPALELNFLSKYKWAGLDFEVEYLTEPYCTCRQTQTHKHLSIPEELDDFKGRAGLMLPHSSITSLWTSILYLSCRPPQGTQRTDQVLLS